MTKAAKITLGTMLLIVGFAIRHAAQMTPREMQEPIIVHVPPSCHYLADKYLGGRQKELTPQQMYAMQGDIAACADREAKK